MAWCPCRSAPLGVGPDTPCTNTGTSSIWSGPAAPCTSTGTSSLRGGHCTLYQYWYKLSTGGPAGPCTSTGTSRRRGEGGHSLRDCLVPTPRPSHSRAPGHGFQPGRELAKTNRRYGCPPVTCTSTSAPRRHRMSTSVSELNSSARPARRLCMRGRDVRHMSARSRAERASRAQISSTRSRRRRRMSRWARPISGGARRECLAVGGRGTRGDLPRSRHAASPRRCESHRIVIAGRCPPVARPRRAPEKVCSPSPPACTLSPCCKLSSSPPAP